MAMLRINKVITEESITLRLEGKLVTPWVDELKCECAVAMVERERLELDLSAVHYADADGVKALTQLKRSEVKLSGCSLFLKALLDRQQ